MLKLLLSFSFLCCFTFVNNDSVLATTLPKTGIQAPQKSLWAAKYPPQYFGQKMPFRDKILLAIAKKVLKKQQMPLACSKIVKTNGEVLEVLIVSITDSEVKYRPCDEPKSADRTLLTVNIDYIQAADGAVIFSSKSDKVVVEKKPKPVKVKQKNTWAYVSFVAGVLSVLPFAVMLLTWSVGSFVLWIMLSLLASVLAIFGAINQLDLIRANPYKYGGEKPSTWGLILGSCAISIWLSLIAFFLLLIIGNNEI